MRHFNEEIFMGGGKNTLREIKRLRKLLSQGLSHLSGLQQPPDPTQPYNLEQEMADNAKYRQELEDIIRDIATALGGKHLLNNSNESSPPPKPFWCNYVDGFCPYP